VHPSGPEPEIRGATITPSLRDYTIVSVAVGVVGRCLGVYWPEDGSSHGSIRSPQSVLQARSQPFRSTL